MPLTLVAAAAGAALVGEAVAPYAQYGVLLLFGVPAIVGGVLTRGYCRKAVTCPHCDASLWDCGTGSFKPRHMKVRTSATACSSCSSRIR